MAPQDEDDTQVEKDDRSGTPEGWPNMPGRSEEKERHAGANDKDADVTEQQRELEKETRH